MIYRNFLTVVFISNSFYIVSSAPVEQLSLESLTGDDIRYRETDDRNIQKSAKPWLNAQVPFVFDSKLPMERVVIVKQAMESYHRLTCIRFVPKSAIHSDYIRFIDSGHGSCFSYVGRQGGAQEIGIGHGCHFQLGIVIHEIAHALGFLHEHTRPDRDKYIKIRFDQIDADRMPNFDKNSESNVEMYGLRYDYLSVLHYGKNYFSKSGQDTILTLDPQYQNKIGQRDNFSECDLEKINRHYGCSKYMDGKGNCKDKE